MFKLWDEDVFRRSTRTLTMSLSTSDTGKYSINSGDELFVQQIDELFQRAPDPETVFAKFEELTTDLISHDRLEIGFYANDQSQSEIAYASCTPLESDTPDAANYVVPNDSEIWVSSTQPLTDQANDVGPVGRFMSEFNQAARERGFLSWMLSPITWNEEVIGYLLFRSKDEATYQEREIQLAGALTEKIAGTLANAHAISEARLESDLRESLLELSRIVSSAKNLEDIPSDFGNIILSITDSDRATVSLLSLSGNTTENILVFGQSLPNCGVRERSPAFGSDAITWLKAETWYVVDENIISGSELERWSQDIAAEAGFHSTMVVPIPWQGSNIAVITIRSRARHHFNSSLLDIANVIANQIAGAVANQIANQETQEQSRIRDLLALIGRVITASQDLDDTFEELAEVITQLIPSERISLITNRAGTDRAMTRYSYGRELFNLPPGGDTRRKRSAKRGDHANSISIRCRFQYFRHWIGSRAISPAS